MDSALLEIMAMRADTMFYINLHRYSHRKLILSRLIALELRPPHEEATYYEGIAPTYGYTALTSRVRDAHGQL